MHRSLGEGSFLQIEAESRMEPEKGKRGSYLHAQRGLKLSGYKEIREECTHGSVQNIQACIGTLDASYSSRMDQTRPAQEITAPGPECSG